MAHTITGLKNGTAYTFRVRAVNAIGTSAASGLSNTVTPSAAVVTGTAPGAPTIRNAASGVAGGAVTAIANWRAGAAGSQPITGFRVTAIPAAGGASITSAIVAVQAGADQTLEMTLPAGNYRFTVQAINAVGTGPASAQSNQVTAQ